MAATPRPRAGSHGRGGCSVTWAPAPSSGGSRSRRPSAPRISLDAERHARAALALAHEIGDADIECMALAQLGRALVRQGRVEQGTALLDEAMTVALGGETSDPLACGDACCTTLVVCDGLADLERATQWCEAVVEFTERRRFLPVQSWCRGIFGAVLIRAGAWDRADAVLTEALTRPGVRRQRRRSRAAARRARRPAAATGP